MKIAIAGKGGAGKTTLSATLARLFARNGYAVLAIDGDPNPNLGVALGIPATDLAHLHPLPRTILQEHKDAAGGSHTTLTAPVAEIMATHGVGAPDGVRLLLTAQVDHAGAGWLCGAHATVRGMLGQLIAETDDLTIVDMEASVEHMGRGTVRYADVLLILAEPYYRSLETVGRTAPLARDLGIARVAIVANKVRTPRDEEAIRRYCAERDLDVIAVLPFDEAVLAADQVGTPVLDRDPQSAYVQVVTALQQQLRPPAAGAAPANGHGAHTAKQ